MSSNAPGSTSITVSLSAPALNGSSGLLLQRQAAGVSAGQAHSLFPDKISSFAFPARGLPVLTNAVLTNAVLTNELC